MRPRRDIRNLELRTQPPANYWDLYEGQGVLLQPRRYGGLCLPAIEAAGAGLALVMPDVCPNRTWPIEPVAVHQAPELILQSLRVDVWDMDISHGIEALQRVLDDLPERQRQSREWAEANSWQQLRPTWERALEDAANHAQTRTYVPPMEPRSVSVIIPWQPDGGERDRNWFWLRNQWKAEFPQFELIEGRCDGQWIKAIAVDNGVNRSTGDTLIIADADVLPEPSAILEALETVDRQTWVVPHTRVLRLNEDSTRRFVAGDEANLKRCRTPYEGIAGGGIVVLTREAWDRCPMDQRFVGWGLEDKSWGYALDTLIGRHVRLPNDLIHLWHPPQPEQSKPRAESDALHDAYLIARDAPRLMSALVAGKVAGPPDPLPRPVRFTSGRASLVARYPGKNNTVRFKAGFFETTDPDMVDRLRRRDDVEEVT